MAYDAAITRSLVSALSTEEVNRSLVEGLMNESVAMQMFRTIPMSKGQTRLPVLDTLPQAFFVSGDTGLKQTTQASWDNKYLNAEEVAVIIPIPESVLDDSDYDIWGAVRPLAVDAATRAIDAAVLFGTNKPATWPDNIIAAADSASHTVVRGTATDAEGGVAGDISAAFALVETDGYAVTGIAANTNYMGLLRNARNADGTRHDEVSSTSAYGVTVRYPARGLWPTGASQPEMVVGDFNEGIMGLRQDFTWKVLDQAALFDNTGALVLNLPQQDAIALRMTVRVAFQVANAIRYDNENDATRYPFAVIDGPAG